MCLRQYHVFSWSCVWFISGHSHKCPSLNLSYHSIVNSVSRITTSEARKCEYFRVIHRHTDKWTTSSYIRNYRFIRNTHLISKPNLTMNLECKQTIFYLHIGKHILVLSYSTLLFILYTVGMRSFYTSFSAVGDRSQQHLMITGELQMTKGLPQ